MTAAVICAGERTEGEQVDRLASLCAAALVRSGVREGDTVGIMVRNEVRFLVALKAARHLGAYAVPINWHFEAEEAGYILEDAGIKLLLVHEDLLQGIQAGVPAFTHVVSLRAPQSLITAYGLAATEPEISRANTKVSAATRSVGQFSLWEDWIGSCPHEGLPKHPRSSMSYTSGTTGRPKGVRREAMTPEHVSRVAQVNAAVFGVRPGARVLVTTPLYHSAPNIYALTALMMADLLVIEPRFDAARTLALVAQHRITHMYLVPTLMHRILGLPADVRQTADLSSLEFVLHGAAPCPPEVKQAMIAWWGPVIHEFYGGGEAGPIAAIGSQESLKKGGSVGRLVPYARVLIADDSGKEVGPGATGTIYVEQQAYPKFTYHGRPDLRAACAHPADAGLFTLGDVGHLDVDGFLYLTDRKKDMVISGGVNIYPAEIEAVLASMPGVRDCAVFGIPDIEFGESLMAVVEVDASSPDARAVQAWLRERLAGYKVPRHVEFSLSLPREESGKIFKRKLREPYWQDAGRSI